VSEVLARRDRALTPEETEQLLRDRLEVGVERAVQEYGVFTLWLQQDVWVAAARLCRDEPLLAYDMFDNLFAVDARDEGFDVVAILYSTSTGNRIALRTRCAGGRDEPTCPSLTDIYRGADWMERETWDMFGIDFPGHPSVEPRILSVENFEGWPLRKDFHLASRAAKPWPGVKEPAELDEDGNVIEREPRLGDAPGPYELDKAMAEQAKLRNPLPPATESGAVASADAEDAELAADSGNVLAGETEQAAEEAEAQAGEIVAEEAGVEARDAAAEAAAKADDRRRTQAEARARKAAERAEAAAEDAAAAEGAEATEDADGDDGGDGEGPR
jgi:NADH:ubiquinone oxidoreductase subunit C